MAQKGVNKHGEDFEIENIAAKYLGFIESAHDIICSIDLDGNINFVNKAIEKLGYEQLEIIGSPFIHIVSQESQAITEDWLHIIKEPRIFRNLEIEFISKDKQIIPFSLNVFPFPARKPQQIHFIARDISQQVKLQEQKELLQQQLLETERERKEKSQEARYVTDTILAHIPSAIVIFDNTLRYESANSQFYTLVKKSPLCMVGMHFKDIFPSLPKQFNDKMRASISQGKQKTLELPFEGKYILIRLVPLKQQQQQQQLMLIFDDITQIRTYEERLEKSVLALQQLNKMKSEFAAIASHELKVPNETVLVTIRAVLEEYRATLPADVKKKLQSVALNAERVQQQIEHVLSLVRREVTKEGLIIEPVNFKEVVSSLLEFGLGTIAAKKGIVLKHSVDSNVPKVMCNQNKIVEVLTNLIENAIKYNEKETIVDVTVTKDDPFLVIEVHDNGRGIDKKYISHLFEQGFRAGEEKKEKEGSGLGLYICKQIIDAHHGTIHVASSVGEGSTFTVRLPIKGPEGKDVREHKQKTHHVKEAAVVGVLATALIVVLLLHNGLNLASFPTLGGLTGAVVVDGETTPTMLGKIGRFIFAIAGCIAMILYVWEER